MPEPAEQVDQGSQVEPIANTPQATADQPTIAKQSDKAPSPQSVMDYLDIPPELQARLAPKAEEKPVGTADVPELPEELPNEQPEELERDVEEEPEAELAPAAEHKVDKKLKRINRLTRQKSELEEQLDLMAQANQELRQRLEQGQSQQRQTQPTLQGGKLPEIQTEIEKCDDMIDWCDENPDGGMLGHGEKAIEADAATARLWRRKAESDRQEFIVAKREELWKLQEARKQSDADAYHLWPEMFDKRTPQFQEAVALIQQYPFLQALPEANLILGTFLEGRRNLRDKLKVTGNGQPEKKHRDLDERVFTTPRVPIAPHTPEPPSREAKPSLQKRVNEAMSRLVDDPDGGAGNVAAAFAAMDAARKTQPNSRSSVQT